MKWTLKCRDSICSLHFVDGIPTKANPLLIMHMDYDTQKKTNLMPSFQTHISSKKNTSRGR